MGENVFKLPRFEIGLVSLSLDGIVNWGLDLHRILDEWTSTKGKGVKVGIIDTGMPNHRDLLDRIHNGVNATKDPYKDVSGHSTHCCGVIGASATSNNGLIGIAPECEMYIGKAFDDSGRGTDESIAQCIAKLSSKGCHILSMSLGAPAETRKFFPKTEKVIKEAAASGIIMVCATGNESASNVGFPALMDEVISVGAINNKKQHADFSNRGKDLDFAAAGVNITSTYLNNSYASLSGSSMATPHITGICALILSKHLSNQDSATPISGVEDMIEHLKRISVDIGPSGWDPKYGWGSPVFSNINVNDPTERGVEGHRKINKSLLDRIKEMSRWF